MIKFAEALGIVVSVILLSSSLTSLPVKADNEMVKVFVKQKKGTVLVMVKNYKPKSEIYGFKLTLIDGSMKFVKAQKGWTASDLSDPANVTFFTKRNPIKEKERVIFLLGIDKESSRFTWIAIDKEGLTADSGIVNIVRSQVSDKPKESKQEYTATESKKRVNLSVMTDKHHYSRGEDVIITGFANPNEEVSVSVRGESGIIFFNRIVASTDGSYEIFMKLGGVATSGTYVVTVKQDGAKSMTELIVVGQSAEKAVRSMRNGAWSDPTIWSTNEVPSFRNDVIISSNTVVTYDMNSFYKIGNLTVQGQLIFNKHKSTHLIVGNIEVSTTGRLEIGTVDNPIPNKYTAIIELVMDTPGQNGLIIEGKAEIHGAPIKHTFTKLARDAVKGSSYLFVVDDAQGWNPGSKIVITTTERDPCTEINSVLVALGRTIITENPLRCYHSGTEPARADVALLTRNVVITSKDPNLKGHTMFMKNASGGISYAEFVNLGPENKLGKYPIHFHKMDGNSQGMYVKGASIWNSTNRWITIHSSKGITLEDNVGYNSVGHGFFLEAGDEVFNTLDHNIGILPNKGKLIPSDDTPAAFWSENPQNRFTNNIAVGGYWGFAILPSDRMKEISDLGGMINLRSLPLLQFDNNEAHHNNFGVESQTTVRPSLIKNLFSWRNYIGGILMHGRGTNVTDSLFFENYNSGVGFLGDENAVINTHIVGAPVTMPYECGCGVGFSGKNNMVINSTLEGHLSIKGADFRINESESQIIIGYIVNTVMLSPRTILFGYPVHNATHIVVQNYIAPNDAHAQLPSDFTLWRIDTHMPYAEPDLYFVALLQRN